MHLTRDLIPAYVELAFPEATPEARAQSVARLAAREAAGEFDLRGVRIRVASDGRPCAAVRVVPLGADVHQMMGPFSGAGEDAGPSSPSLVAEALAHARALGARRVVTRIVEGRAPPSHLVDLAAAGFVRRDDRIEFKTDLAALPEEADSPLAWRSMAEVGREAAAETLRRASQGDPGTSEDEDPATAITECLSAPDLYRDPDCVHVGYVDGAPVAFVCAQVAPATGWARISYLGVVPEARGRGLGRHLHRHGFAMLRAQGGRLYHGGTSTANAAMLGLFRSSGCRVHARMSDWVWTAPGAT